MFCQGTVINGRRSKKTMGVMSLIVLDCDKINDINEVVEAAKRAGIAVAVITTHTHYSTTTDVEWKHFETWRGRSGTDVTLDEATEFFRQRGKHMPGVVDSISLAERARGTDGWVIRVTHAPVHKCRVVAFLKEPMDFNAYEDLDEGNEAWACAIMGFAAKLGIEIDESCTDSSRAFYSPSHPSGTNDHQVIYVAGDLVDFHEVEAAGRVLKGDAKSPSAPAKAPVKAPQRKQPAQAKAQAQTGEKTKLVHATRLWAKKFAMRFLVTDALAAYSPNLLTSAALGGKGRHIERCPYCERHSNTAGDSSTYVCNAIADPRSGFKIQCMHASCKDTDRLEFLQRLIDNGSLPAEALADPRFLLEDANAELIDKIAAEFQQPTNQGKYAYRIY